MELEAYNDTRVFVVVFICGRIMLESNSASPYQDEVSYVENRLGLEAYNGKTPFVSKMRQNYVRNQSVSTRFLTSRIV